MCELTDGIDIVIANIYRHMSILKYIVGTVSARYYIVCI